jgi:hypothetical protein
VQLAFLQAASLADDRAGLAIVWRSIFQLLDTTLLIAIVLAVIIGRFLRALPC